MKPNDIQISDWITLIAAGIAALSAVVAAIFSVIAVFSTNRRLDLVRESDFRRKQLDEFYGPLVMLRLRSAKLREQLSPLEAGWRLINNMKDIQADSDSRRKEIVEKILKINATIMRLLTDKASLLEVSPMRDEYKAFVAHSDQLQMLWDQRRNAKEGEVAFPRGLDEVIAAEEASVRARLKKLKK